MSRKIWYILTSPNCLLQHCYLYFVVGVGNLRYESLGDLPKHICIHSATADVICWNISYKALPLNWLRKVKPRFTFTLCKVSQDNNTTNVQFCFWVMNIQRPIMGLMGAEPVLWFPKLRNACKQVQPLFVSCRLGRLVCPLGLPIEVKNTWKTYFAKTPRSLIAAHQLIIRSL